jgi:phage terminase large subunit
MPVHWIYEELDREDAISITTTYKDNPFLTEYQIKEIERLKEIDPMRWRVYGLGKRGSFQLGQILTGWQPITLQEYNELPYPEILGLDWGFSNDPCAVIGVKYHNRRRYYRKYIYQTELGNQTLAKMLPKDKLVIADSAEPKSIREVAMQGIKIKPSKKGPDSIRFGINAMKENQNFYVKDSDLEFELNNYVYQINANEEILDKPEDKHNHLLDAARYAELYLTFKPRKIIRR